MIAIGIDLGGTNINAALVHKSEGIIRKISIPTEADKRQDHVFDRIKIAVDTLMQNRNTRGGIEAYLDQRFLSRYAANSIRQHPDNPLYKEFSEQFDQLEPVNLYKAAEYGNELAAEILRKSVEKLCFAIVNYIHILDIRKIVAGGGLAKACRWLLEPAKSTTLLSLMPPFHEDFKICYDPLGNDTALCGASSLALEHL